MADNENEPAPLAPEPAPEGGGVGMRAEMAVGEFLLRHGWKLAAIVASILVGIAVYGMFSSMAVEAQRKTTAAIADIEATLGKDLVQIAQEKALGMEAGFDEAGARKAADDLAALAREASGTAAVEAWLKSAELYRIVGDATQRRAALEAAASGTTGVLRYAAVAALANLDLEEGDSASSIQRFQSLQQEPEFLARQATLDLANVYEALGRSTDAAAAYADYLKRWPEAPDAEEVRQRAEKVGSQG